MNKQTLHFMPRGLKKNEAAAYIRCSQTKFDEMVKDGRMPQPRQIDRARIWDIRELDHYFELLPQAGIEEPNEWDEI